MLVTAPLLEVSMLSLKLFQALDNRHCSTNCQSTNVHLVSLGLIRGVSRQQQKTKDTKHQMFKVFDHRAPLNCRGDDIVKEVVTCGMTSTTTGACSSESRRMHMF